MPPSKYKFLEPVSYDHLIGESPSGGKIGEIRIKPSSLLWKPKGQQKYYSASLDDFAEWIVKFGKQVKQ
jgi:hypothetical protein